VGTRIALKAKLGTLCGKLTGGTSEAMTLIRWLRVQEDGIIARVLLGSGRACVLGLGRSGTTDI